MTCLIVYYRSNEAVVLFLVKMFDVGLLSDAHSEVCIYAILHLVIVLPSVI